LSHPIRRGFCGGGDAELPLQERRRVDRCGRVTLYGKSYPWDQEGLKKQKFSRRTLMSVWNQQDIWWWVSRFVMKMSVAEGEDQGFFRNELYVSVF
jgi:hypothetical protein